MKEKKDYKNTLLMPNTSFEMKANLVKKQEKYIKYWDNEKIYSNWNKGKNQTFNLHDGPPYANGSIHVGHALNKILKDIIIRYNALNGKKIEWKIGWDTHGLPIELEVQKKKGSLDKLGIENYLNEAKKYALSQVEIQKKQFKSLSLSTNFNDTYLTLNKNYETRQLEVFSEMFRKKLIYQDLKPIYWSWSSRTALAESEVEYKDIESPSVYVPFKIVKGPLSGKFLVIWTTTPWTLLANVAIALGKDVDYILTKYGNKEIIIASDLKTSLEGIIGKKLVVLKKLGKGNSIIEKGNVLAINPLNNSDSKIVIGNHVTTESGTGLVHIAGGHGLEDFEIAKLNKLKVFSVLDDNGHIEKTNTKYDSLFYLKAEKLIVDDLKESSNLISYSIIKHSYPHDWRTKKPLVYRATKQWFASIEKIKKDLIKANSSINWIPEWGKSKAEKMIIERNDWCISRQRSWGFPIPIIYDENKKPINSKDYFENLKLLFSKHGSIIWFTFPIEKLLPKSIKYHSKMIKESDTLDVWFDSGSSWNSVVRESKSKFPADLYLEGSDQYRGWFASSLITSYAVTNSIMTKSILTHGFVLDMKGNKMSKSKGNVIDPLKIVNDLGSDILRLWVATVDYQLDVRIGQDILKQTSEIYRKLRNTFRFMLSNIDDFDYKKNQVKNLSGVHLLILEKLQKLIHDLENSYKNYEFNKVVSRINLFFINDLSSFYFDYAKDVLYTKEINNLDRRSIQTVMYIIVENLVVFLSPILPVTSEEIYEHFKKENKKKSVFLEKLNLYKIEKIEKIINWDDFFIIRNLVNKELENLKIKKKINKTNESQVTMTYPKEKKYLEKIDNLSDLLLVADVVLKEGNKLKITAKNFSGKKCERCWKYFDKLVDQENICNSCYKIVKNSM